MSKIKITINTVVGTILWESEKDTLKEAVLEKFARDANLRGANLRDANLYGADLRDADLRDADLYGANEKTLPQDFVNQSSRDILFILGCLKSEVPGLRQMLIDGKVDGSAYTDRDCVCLIGSLAKLDGGMDAVCTAIPFYEKGTHRRRKLLPQHQSRRYTRNKLV
jgi:hypothetical protein